MDFLGRYIYGIYDIIAAVYTAKLRQGKTDADAVTAAQLLGTFY